MSQSNKQVIRVEEKEMKRIVIFLAITFGITFCLEFGLLYPLFIVVGPNPAFTFVYQLY